MKKVLLLNSVKCLGCNKVLTSTHRHDFVSCGCENQTFVDGGLAYQRTGAVNLGLIEDLAVYQEFTDEQYAERVEIENKLAKIKLQDRIDKGEMVYFAGKYWSKKVFEAVFESKGLV